MADYYPTSLPGPTKSVHTPKARVSSPGMPGVGGYSARERDYSGTQDVEFFLTQEQAAVWYAWWKDTLLEGGNWFNANWPALRPGFMVLQFRTEPVFTHVYNGACRISATVQVRGTSLEIAVTPACFVESFASLTPYATISGNRALYTLVSDAYGATLDCAQQNSTTIAKITRSISAMDLALLRCRVRVTVSASDDAAFLVVGDTGVGGSITFTPRREAAYDGLSRAHLFITQQTGGLSWSGPLGTVALTVGHWYEFQLALVAGRFSYFIDDLTLGVPLVSGSATGSSWVPIRASYVSFDIGSHGLTSRTQYAAGLRICPTV